MSSLKVIPIVILSLLSGARVACAQLKILDREQLRVSVSPAKSADSSSIAFRYERLDGIRIREDGGVQQYSFPFVNIANSPLTITAVTGNCSCIKAFPASACVQPGEASEIRVLYDPLGHSGQFRRRLLVYTASGDKPAAVLEMNVVVEASDPLSADYPVCFGSLRLRRASIGFCRGVPSVESIRVVNAGRAPLSVSCESAFLPDCISVSPSVLRLEAGEEAKLTVSYKPSGSEEYSDRKYQLRLRGTGVSPRNAVIELKINIPK